MHFMKSFSLLIKSGTLAFGLSLTFLPTLSQAHNQSHDGYAILYTGERFTGESYRLFAGEAAARKSDLDNGLVSFRYDHIRSIELRGDVVLELWTNSNFRGQSTRLTQSSPDLRNLPPSRQNWGGRIQSLRADIGEDENYSSAPITGGGTSGVPPLGASGGVVIFSEAGYGGSSYIFENTGAVPNLSRLPQSNLRWNDRVASVYIDGSYSVVLYEDGDFNGNYVVINKSVENLSQLRASNGSRIGWDRSVSSMEIIRKGRGVDRPNHRSQYAGSLYEDDKFTGKYFALYEGQVIHDLKEWLWNDEASSVMVEEGYQIVLYADSNFRGASLTIDQNQNSLRRLPGRWNDAASSLKVVKKR